jgi:hypothetical protein
MYVCARNLFDKIFKKNQIPEIALFLQKILNLLLHCRTNIDWHVSILNDWLSDFAKRHLSIISPIIFITTPHLNSNKLTLQQTEIGRMFWL